MNNFLTKIEELEHRIDIHIKYIWEKIEEKDWHAVSDAAMDIREFNAKIEVYKELE